MTSSPWSSYLNDHLAAATAGRQLFRRAAATHQGDELGDELAALVLEVMADRQALLDVMALLEVRPSRSHAALGWTGERLGRLKLNGTLLRRSPTTDLVELEGMRLLVTATGCCWEVLRAASEHDSRIQAPTLDALMERAADQGRRLRALQLQVAGSQQLG